MVRTSHFVLPTQLGSYGQKFSSDTPKFISLPSEHIWKAAKKYGCINPKFDLKSL